MPSPAPTHLAQLQVITRLDWCHLIYPQASHWFYQQSFKYA